MPFVYGHFTVKSQARLLQPPPGSQAFALEILQEYSPNELKAKVLARSGSSWSIVDRHSLSALPWWRAYQQHKKHLCFRMEGSGLWEVLHFRDESDQSGPYLAVALRYSNE